jgi:hypothetical protein
MTAASRYRQLAFKSVVAGIALILGIGCLYPATILGLTWVHNFLAVTRPVETDVLVLEGWLFDYMLDAAAREINSGGYTQVLITGFETAVPEKQEYQGLMSSSESCKAKLIARGVNAAIIHAISAPRTINHHTFHMAAAIKDWLTSHQIRAVNVYTGGPHARKSLVMFQKILGKDVRVGVISSRIRHYDPDRWWASERGIKVTLRYLAGYFYALVWPL